jgi:hypothetical protein
MPYDYHKPNAEKFVRVFFEGKLYSSPNRIESALRCNLPKFREYRTIPLIQALERRE